MKRGYEVNLLGLAESIRQQQETGNVADPDGITLTRMVLPGSGWYYPDPDGITRIRMVLPGSG